MAQVSHKQQTEVKAHLSEIRNNLDRTIQDAKEASKKMLEVNMDETIKLGLDTVQKSLEHTRAIINQTEQVWDSQTVEAGVR